MSIPRWAKVPKHIPLLMTLGGFFIVLWSTIWRDVIMIGWGLFILGGGILGVVILAQYKRYQFMKQASHADGIVIAHNWEMGDGIVWYPIVRYVLPDGQEVTFQSRAVGYGFRWPLTVSTKVGVLYDPENPANAMINRFLEKFGPLFAIPLAVLIIVMGMLIVVGIIHQ